MCIPSVGPVITQCPLLHPVKPLNMLDLIVVIIHPVGLGLASIFINIIGSLLLTKAR